MNFVHGRAKNKKIFLTAKTGLMPFLLYVKSSKNTMEKQVNSMAETLRELVGALSLDSGNT